jgi:hypothetical protein
MRSRVTVAALAQTVSLVVVVVGCGGKHAATPTTKTPSTFSARAVRQAFASVGLRLHDPAPSGSSPHFYVTVTMLTSVRPHDGWSVAVYIYPTTNHANSAFSQDVGPWSAKRHRIGAGQERRRGGRAARAPAHTTGEVLRHAETGVRGTPPADQGSLVRRTGYRSDLRETTTNFTGSEPV